MKSYSLWWAWGFPATVKAAGQTCRSTDWYPSFHLILNQHQDPRGGPLREAS